MLIIIIRIFHIKSMNSSTTLPDTFSDTSTEPETFDFLHPAPKTHPQ